MNNWEFSGLFAALLLAGCVSAFEPDTQLSNSCAVADVMPWRFCVSRAANSAESRVLYFFHGGGMSETTWAKAGNIGHAVRQEWSRAGAKPPVVVSISFGETWFATQGAPKSDPNDLKFGLLTDLPDRVIPHVEKNGLNAPVRERSLLGLSMGGYNAGRLAFDGKYEWARVALVCPALQMPVRRKGETNAELAKRHCNSLFGWRRAAALVGLH